MNSEAKMPLEIFRTTGGKETDNRPKSLRQRLMNHPRGRVAYEERGEILPGWLFRYMWRPLIGTTIRRMKEEDV